MLKNYLKVALKVLGRRKFFTFISLFGISVTLVFLVVASAMLDHIFASQAPETRGDRTLGIYQIGLHGENRGYTGFSGYGLSQRLVGGLDKELPVVEKVAVFTIPGTAVSYADGRKIESMLKRTDGEFWQILDFDFVEGGPFTPDDEKNARFVAVINETTRERFFGGAPALGKSIEVSGQRFRVVGVVRDVPILRFVPFADIWVPNSTTKSRTYRTDYQGDYMAILLARSRGDFPAIKAEVAARFKEAEAHIPDPQMFQHLSGGADTLFEAFSRIFFTTTRLQESHPERLLGVLAAAGRTVHGPAHGQPGEYQSQPHPRPGVGDRRPQGVRRLVADAGRTVRGRKRRAHPGGRRDRSRPGGGGAGRDQCQRRHPLRPPRPEPPGLPLWLGHCPVLRPVLRGLSRLEDVPAPPRPGPSREACMTRHLLKLVWNRKRTNALLIVEIFFSFLVVFAVGTLAAYFMDSYRRPLGFTWKDLWVARIDMQQVSDDTFTQEQVDLFARLLKEVQLLDEVEAVAGTMVAPYDMGVLRQRAEDQRPGRGHGVQ